jgi:hypothetical protein
MNQVYSRLRATQLARKSFAKQFEMYEWLNVGFIAVSFFILALLYV